MRVLQFNAPFALMCSPLWQNVVGSTDASFEHVPSHVTRNGTLQKNFTGNLQCYIPTLTRPK